MDYIATVISISIAVLQLAVGYISILIISLFLYLFKMERVVSQYHKQQLAHSLIGLFSCLVMLFFANNGQPTRPTFKQFVVMLVTIILGLGIFIVNHMIGGTFINLAAKQLSKDIYNPSSWNDFVIADSVIYLGVIGDTGWLNGNPNYAGGATVIININNSTENYNQWYTTTYTLVTFTNGGKIDIFVNATMNATGVTWHTFIGNTNSTGNYIMKYELPESHPCYIMYNWYGNGINQTYVNLYNALPNMPEGASVSVQIVQTSTDASWTPGNIFSTNASICAAYLQSMQYKYAISTLVTPASMAGAILCLYGVIVIIIIIMRLKSNFVTKMILNYGSAEAYRLNNNLILIDGCNVQPAITNITNVRYKEDEENKSHLKCDYEVSGVNYEYVFLQTGYAGLHRDDKKTR